MNTVVLSYSSHGYVGHCGGKVGGTMHGLLSSDHPGSHMHSYRKRFRILVLHTVDTNAHESTLMHMCKKQIICKNTFKIWDTKSLPEKSQPTWPLVSSLKYQTYMSCHCNMLYVH